MKTVCTYMLIVGSTIIIFCVIGMIENLVNEKREIKKRKNNGDIEKEKTGGV